MLDVIVMDNRPHTDEYHDRCIRSVNTAIARAGFPVRLVETQGNLKDIAKARIAAFDQTEAPYVTWVVDFDYVRPDYFACMKGALDSGADAVFAREARVVLQKPMKSFNRHHGAYRRELIESVRGVFEAGSVDEATQALLAAARGANSVDIQNWGYIRRMDADAIRAFRKGCQV